MTNEEKAEKYEKVLNEISDIELTADKSRRIRWRELQKLKNWLKSKLKQS